MLKTLVLIRIKSMFAGMFSRGKKKAGAGKILLFVLLAIYLLVCFGTLFISMFASMCDTFVALDMTWLYFGLIGIMVFLLCFLGSVFITQSQLYEAKDNDLLLSMPIPVRNILASRLLSIIVVNYIYELLVIIPGAIVYCFKAQVTLTGAIFFVAAFVILPLLVVCFSAIFGWIIAIANTRMRNKNVIMMIISMVLFLGYMYLCLRLQHYLQMLIQNGAAIGEAVKKALPPFYYMGKAIADSDVVSFLVFLACCIVPFAIIYVILDRSFIKLATTKRGGKKIKYQEKEVKVQGVRWALLQKELRHFLGTPMYIFNAAVGLVFTVIGAGYLFIKKDEMIQMVQMMGVEEYVGPVLCAAFGAMASLTIISSPMISIEARTLWISKSLPVKEKDVLLAKADVHTVCSVPFILVSVVLMEIAFDMSILSRVMLLLVPLAITVFNAYMGLAINLKYPKFDWVNEVDAVKHGLAPLLAMLISMVSAAMAILIYPLLLSDMLDIETYVCLVFVVFAIGSFLLYRYLIGRGVEVYKKL